MKCKLRHRLPQNPHGDRNLIQWYCITANTYFAVRYKNSNSPLAYLLLFDCLFLLNILICIVYPKVCTYFLFVFTFLRSKGEVCGPCKPEQVNCEAINPSLSWISPLILTHCLSLFPLLVIVIIMLCYCTPQN